nr:hypothetical protein GCM10020092_053180 [Actinoplanes digitatis]
MPRRGQGAGRRRPDGGQLAAAHPGRCGGPGRRLDTRALIAGTATRVELPHRLNDGCLGLRVWDRPAYAEIAAVRIDGDGLRIEGRLVGAEPAGPVLELRGDTDRELPSLRHRLRFRGTDRRAAERERGSSGCAPRRGCPRYGSAGSWTT